MADSPFLRKEIPQTQSRLKWQATIHAGPDTSEILGLGKNSNTSQVLSQLVTGSSTQLIGAIENLEIVQTRTLVERYGFGPNPHQPFQVVPTSLSAALKLSKVVLFGQSTADKVFNFYPNNLLFQQLPFVIQADLPGLSGGTSITHFFLGCWFIDSHVQFGVNSGSDQRLINTCNVKVTRQITLDGTGASIDGNIGTDVVGGILSFGDNQNTLDDFDLT